MADIAATCLSPVYDVDFPRLSNSLIGALSVNTLLSGKRFSIKLLLSETQRQIVLIVVRLVTAISECLIMYVFSFAGVYRLNLFHVRIWP